MLVEVPGPEADWEVAAAYQGGKRNPALQGSMWDYAAGGLRLVAGLSPSLGALAERLRLDIERSWEDPLGEVEAAMFSIGKIHFAFSHNDGHPRPDTKVWVSRDQADVDAALDVLLHALGIGRETLAYCLDPETDTYVELHPTRAPRTRLAAGPAVARLRRAPMRPGGERLRGRYTA